MIRFLLPTAVATLVLSACTADLKESCISGPCESDKPEAASSSSATGAGGQGGQGGAPPNCDEVPAKGEFPCEVWDVLVARCHKCHTEPKPMGIPFSLVTFESTREPYGNVPIWKKMTGAIDTDFMPLGGPALMGDDRKTMKDWLAACAPPVADGMGCEMKP